MKRPQDGQHVSIASLLLSESQRGQAMRLRGDRTHNAALPEFRPDYRELTRMELDAKVPKDRFQKNWLGSADGDRIAGIASRDGSRLCEEMRCTNGDIDALWNRMSPDQNAVSLAAIVGTLSPCPEHRAQARKRLVILAGGRSGPGTFLFGGPSESQRRGGALPEKSPHMRKSPHILAVGDGYDQARVQATGVKRLLILVMQRVSARLNHLLRLPWQGFPDAGFRTCCKEGEEDEEEERRNGHTRGAVETTGKK